MKSGVFLRELRFLFDVVWRAGPGLRLSAPEAGTYFVASPSTAAK